MRMSFNRLHAIVVYSFVCIRRTIQATTLLKSCAETVQNIRQAFSFQCVDFVDEVIRIGRQECLILTDDLSMPFDRNTGGVRCMWCVCVIRFAMCELLILNNVQQQLHFGKLRKCFRQQTTIQQQRSSGFVCSRLYYSRQQTILHSYFEISMDECIIHNYDGVKPSYYFHYKRTL